MTAEESINLEDLNEGVEQGSYVWKCPCGQAITVTPENIAGAKHTYRCSLCSYSAKIVFGENDMGVANFFLGNYEASVDMYSRAMREWNEASKNKTTGVAVADDELGGAEFDFNIWEALNEWSKSSPDDKDLRRRCLDRYRQLCPCGEHANEFWFVAEEAAAEEAAAAAAAATTAAQKTAAKQAQAAADAKKAELAAAAEKSRRAAQAAADAEEAAAAAERAAAAEAEQVARAADADRAEAEARARRSAEEAEQAAARAEEEKEKARRQAEEERALTAEAEARCSAYMKKHGLNGLDDVVKKLRKMRKKLKQIEELKARMAAAGGVSASASSLTPDQRNKLAQEESVKEEVSVLESLVGGRGLQGGGGEE